MAHHDIKKDFQTKLGGTLVLFKMERAIGMWNVLVQKSFKWHIVWGSEEEELVVWGSEFPFGPCGAVGSGFLPDLCGAVDSRLA